jgi:hypothetical protein
VPNTDFVAIAAGGYHSLGLKADGSIVAWGYNLLYGVTNVPSPNAGFIAVAADGYHSLGLKADGSIVAWGANDYGQTNVPSPNTGFVAIAAGYYHSLGIKSYANPIPTVSRWGIVVTTLLLAIASALVLTRRGRRTILPGVRSTRLNLGVP